MFGLGFSEILLLGILALLLIGPKQLPEVARGIARFINEIKRTTDDFKGQLNQDIDVSHSDPVKKPAPKDESNHES